MSEENVEAFRRGIAAMNRGDIEGMLDVCDPQVEWRDAINTMFGGEATIYRGLDAVRDLFGDLYGSFTKIDADYSDVRSMGEHVLGLGQLRMLGRESGAETESPVAALTTWRNGRAIRVLTYLDHAEALEAAGLSE